VGATDGGPPGRDAAGPATAPPPDRRAAAGAGRAAAELIRPLLLPLAVAACGCVAGHWLPISGHTGGAPYRYLTYALLAVGLYGSAYGITRPEARGDVYRVIAAITVGVVGKAAFVAGVLALCFHHRDYLVLAVAMAQIDPLSVSALLESRDMSPRAKSLLAAWASFDDPVTTILVVYAGATWLDGATGIAAGTTAYGGTLLLNLALLAVAAGLWLALRPHRLTRAAGVPVGRGRNAARVAGLLALAAVAVWRFLMLGLALSALFFRPALGRWIGRAANLSLVLATLLLGLLLAGGVDLKVGAVLGCATFTAQMLVGALVTWGYPARDRAALCLSQQNGITAIILALLLQPLVPSAVAVTAPAILVVNVLHLTANSLLQGAFRTRTRRGGAHRS
jgi:hypothetical protein